MGKPLPHGALGMDGGAPAPPLELPRTAARPELLVPLPVVVLGEATGVPAIRRVLGAGLTCRGSGICAEADIAHSKIAIRCPKPILSVAHSGRRFV